MQEDEEYTNFAEFNKVKPPRGLFARIIKRLGLEKQLRVVRRHLGFFAALLGIFLFLSIFAFIGLRQVLAESSFGPYLSLIFSDPGIVLKYWRSFTASVFESIPGNALAILLFFIALFLFFIRLASAPLEKLLLLLKSVHKYNHKPHYRQLEQ